jgi:glycosyltransferase involved in cell wall biosynthesis
MFSARERAQRDRNFRALLSRAEVVLVNAADVANDLENFYAPFPARIAPLPFAACADPEWFVGALTARTRYGISSPYFLVSNQFWKHKNHAVVLAAAALARQQGDPVQFVFTGETRDYRHPQYYRELLDEIARNGSSDDVHILGFIPKGDQIQLMREAEAVVQPSLFEGGPGGGATYNAIALGRPVVLSDLAVNREIEALSPMFFDPADPADLLKQLRLVQGRTATPPDPVTLFREGEERRRRFGVAIRRAFAEACGV